VTVPASLVLRILDNPRQTAAYDYVRGDVVLRLTEGERPLYARWGEDEFVLTSSSSGEVLTLDIQEKRAAS